MIVGQHGLMHRMLVGLLGNGHLLIEGVPGLAKTTAVACLAKGIHTKFQRLQFTPDLLPAASAGAARSSQTTIINGRADERTSVTYVWQITPRREGTFTIPAM